MKLLIFLSSLPGFLTITFIILKVLNIIEWSWLIVFSPLWFTFLSSMIFILLLIFHVKIYKRYLENFFKINDY